MWARRCRPGRNPIRAFPFHLSWATCRPGNVSPAISRPGYPGFVAGEYGKCCSASSSAKELVPLELFDAMKLDVSESSSSTSLPLSLSTKSPSMKPDSFPFAPSDSTYVVPTGRVVVPTGRYVVPAGKVIIIVSPGRLNLVPTGSILSPGRVK
ncbi:hypothetical protein Tco_0917525 [Tanacetum coccineum]